MKFAICNETYQGWSWEKTCNAVAETGYNGIELAPFTLADDVKDLSQSTRKQVRSAAVQAGLDIVGLHWLLVSPKGLHLTGPDSEIRDKTIHYLCDLADLASDLEAPFMIFGSPNQRNLMEGVTREECRSRAMEGARKVGQHAQGRGVTLCMEALPFPEANFLTTLQEVREFVEEVDHPHVRMMMDVKSASSENQPLQDLYQRHKSFIQHIHANDANRRGPGFGDTDFVPLIKTLLDHDYQAAVSVEVFDYSPDPETIARISLDTLRKAFKEAQSV